MRTTTEIIKSTPRLNRMCSCTKGLIAKAINTARRELLEEASERATVTSSCSVWNCEGESVDKQSILNLIKELK